MPEGLTRSEQVDWFVNKWGKVEKRVPAPLEYDAAGKLLPARYISTEIDRVFTMEGIDGLTAHDTIIRKLDALFSSRPDVADKIRRVGTMEGLRIYSAPSVKGQASYLDYLSFRASVHSTVEAAGNLVGPLKEKGWLMGSTPARSPAFSATPSTRPSMRRPG